MKIGFETAKKIARDVNKKVDHCTETKDAFIFIAEEDRFSFNDAQVVVLKNNGDVVNFLWYMKEMHGSVDPINEFDF